MCLQEAPIPPGLWLRGMTLTALKSWCGAGLASFSLKLWLYLLLQSLTKRELPQPGNMEDLSF